MSLPPGPRTPTIVQTLAWTRRPIEQLETYSRRYGDIFTMRLLSVGDLVVVSTPELIRQVLVADSQVLRAGASNEILRPLVGDYSVLLLDGQEHLRQRRLLMPPFSGERMSLYAEVMKNATLAVIRDWPIGRPFDVHASMQAITLNAILHTIFGLGEGSEIARFRTVLTELFRAPPSFLLLLPALRVDMPLSPYRSFLRARAAVDREIYRLIAERRGARDLGERLDVLSLLLRARDEAGQPMSDEEVHDELLTMILAGHETSATALVWTLERLLSEPQALERAIAEVASVTHDSPLDPAAIAKLEYLDAVVKEVLRLRPILPILGRQTFAPYELGGYTLPPGVVITPCVYLVQRRADIYPEPERFYPERWLGAKVQPYAWLPFGGGIRRCVGMAFALYELKVILATMLSRVRLRAPPGPPARAVRRTVTLFPENGVQAIVTERSAMA